MPVSGKELPIPEKKRMPKKKKGRGYDEQTSEDEEEKEEENPNIPHADNFEAPNPYLKSMQDDGNYNQPTHFAYADFDDSDLAPSKICGYINYGKFTGSKLNFVSVGTGKDGCEQLDQARSQHSMVIFVKPTTI
jgi:hypothetical protein